jgi:Aerotolerance regulator N-terminal/von Willebrand factor type A domain
VSFLAPLFLAGAVAAAVPILLHMLERPPEQHVRFAAVALLKGAPVEHTARRRLRGWLLLALRVGALVLLALAFARPFFGAAQAGGARLTVVAIDTSLSMSAPARVARARQLSRDAIRQAPAGDDVAVVAFADRAEVIVPPTQDRGAATSAVEAVTPGFGSTRYAAALAAAGALFHGRTGAIVVVTDLQASGWDAGVRAAVPDAVRVDVNDAGPLAENLSVEALRAEGDRLVASVHNQGDRARDVRTHLTVDGRAAGQVVVSVVAHGSADAVFPNVRASTSATAGAVAAVTVDDPGGIPGDDTRYALIGGQSTAHVLAVTTSGDLDLDAWFVRHALGDVRGAAAADLAGWADDVLRRYGAVVILSTRGLERRGRERLAAYVNAGGGVLIAAGPDVDADVIADVLGAGAPIEMKTAAGDAEGAAPRGPISLAPADVRHPIFRSFGAEIASLGLVQFHRVARVSGRSCQAIARFTSGDAAVLDCVTGAGRAIVIASDLNNAWNDFPARASFLPFLDQAVRYLSNSATRGVEYFPGDVPAGVAAVPGVTTAAAAGGSRRIVVNVDPRESEADRISAADFQASIARLKDAGAEEVRADVAARENRQHLWQYLLAAMIAALAAEGVVAWRMA